MRWIQPTFEEGTTRIVKRFLLLPLGLPRQDCEIEWRWLETARIHQEHMYGEWEDMCWANEKTN